LPEEDRETIRRSSQGMFELCWPFMRTVLPPILAVDHPKVISCPASAFARR
jgi:hypothetical protein